MGDLTKDFSKVEFKCGNKNKPCCGLFIENKELIKKLQKLRNAVGVPITINSGTRCKTRNDSLKDSSPTSSHLTGKAADITCRDMFLLRRYAYQIFDRIGIAKDFIHVDVDDTKIQLTDWLYPNPVRKS